MILARVENIEVEAVWKAVAVHIGTGDSEGTSERLDRECVDQSPETGRIVGEEDRILGSRSASRSLGRGEGEQRKGEDFDHLQRKRCERGNKKECK